MIWLDFNKSFEEFSKIGRNRSGTLIEVLYEGKRKQYLIGDINKSATVEDGGKPFLPSSAIVLKYKIIYSPN